jgi:hypothetical protein
VLEAVVVAVAVTVAVTDGGMLAAIGRDRRRRGRGIDGVAV